MTDLSLTNLISHRFRGFSTRENTLEGLLQALDFGVQNLEFDVRMARCGTPMVYHDEYALDGKDQKQSLSDYKTSSFAGLGGAFAFMPELDALLRLCAHHPNQTAKLLIDIKELGFEEQIHSLVMAHKLSHRVVYVSWVSDVLYRVHKLAPHIPLCLSHWCGPTNRAIAKKHIIYKSKDGTIPATDRPFMMGERSGWEVSAPIQGDMLEILKATQGGVCVPQDMISRDLVDYYHDHGLFVSTFSYTGWDHINDHRDTFNVDLYFIDNKHVFEEIVVS